MIWFIAPREQAALGRLVGGFPVAPKPLRNAPLNISPNSDLSWNIFVKRDKTYSF